MSEELKCVHGIEGLAAVQECNVSLCTRMEKALDLCAAHVNTKRATVIISADADTAIAPAMTPSIGDFVRVVDAGFLRA